LNTAGVGLISDGEPSLLKAHDIVGSQYTVARQEKLRDAGKRVSVQAKSLGTRLGAAILVERQHEWKSIRHQLATRLARVSGFSGFLLAMTHFDVDNI
jgi:hypothetical protein